MNVTDWPMPRGARLRLTLAWLAVSGRRHPVLAIAAALSLAALAILAATAPARSCQLRAVATPGMRAHFACEQVTP